MGEITRNDIVRVDLDKPLQRSRYVLAEGDDRATVFGAELHRSGVGVDLSGATVKGFFIRGDGATEEIHGIVSGSTVSVTLTEQCYVTGNFTLSIKVMLGDVTHTVRRIDGFVSQTATDLVGGETAVSLTETVERSEAAAGRAETAANRSETAVGLAVEAAERAEEAARNAGTGGGGGGSGEPGADGFSPVAQVQQTSDGAVITVTDKYGTTTATVKNGKDGKDGAAGATGSQGPAGPTGPTGATGQRGVGILKVTTSPTSYTTTTGGVSPIKRMSISTIKSESDVSEVLVGDQISYSYYLYHIYYLDSTYAYMDTYQSIRGATGAAGSAGANGTDGKTPVKGVDYFTTAEKNAMVQEVIDTIGLTVIGEVDNANNILITMPLPDGTYTMRYENADGSTTEIGSFTVNDGGGDEPVGPTYTNLADPTSADWLTNKRYNSSKNLVDVTTAQSGGKTVVVTNFISTTGLSKLHIKGLNILDDVTSGTNYGRMYTYKGTELLSTTYVPSVGLTSPVTATHYTIADYDSSVVILDVAKAIKDWGYTGITNIRLGGFLEGAATDVIITADQPIV